MSKQYKIKRYHKNGNTYRARPHPLMVLLGIVLVAGLVFMGTIIYEPVANFILKSGSLRDDMDLSSIMPEQESQAEESEPEPPPKPEEPDALRTVYLPTSKVTGADTLDAFLATLDGTDINAVMVDIKTAEGKVLFNTANPNAIEWGAVTEAPFDLKALGNKLKSKNLSLVVRMSAFRDPLAAGAGRSNAITYQQTQWLWLDNTAENGGKPWLNPYAPDARQYLTDLALEAVDAGAKLVILDNCAFPVGSQANANFGAEAEGISRPQALSSFLDELETKLAEKNARVAPYLTAISLNQEAENATRYGGSPLDAIGKNIILGALPYQYGGDYSIGGLTVTQPVDNPGPAVAAAVQYAAAALPQGEEHTIIPLLQGGNDLGVNAVPYGKEQVEAQIQAAKAASLTEYILYVTDGAYVLG